MDWLICAYWTYLSVMMLEFLSGCILSGDGKEEDSALMDEGLRTIKPKLATKKGPNGQVTPGLSV